MASRKFRWSIDGGFTWTYEDQTLPYIIPVNAIDAVIVQPLGEQSTITGANYNVRTVPATADRHYVVVRENGMTKSYRLERNLGASATSSDLGGIHPEWRKTGEGYLPSFGANPATQTIWIGDEVGAFDMVGRDSSGKNFGSYHGLGTGGSKPSETLQMDGVNVDPTVASFGNSYVVRNTTIATDGVATLTRDMSVTFSANTCKYTIHSISQSGLVLFYFGMPIATGNNYSELWAKTGTGWTILDLGTSGDGAQAYLSNVKAIRMRDPATGYYSEASGVLPTLANFVQCRTDKQPQNGRTKTYLAQFSDVTSLSNAEFFFSVGASIPGNTSLASNLISDPNWVTNWTNHATTGGTISKANTDLTFTWSTGTSNLRISSPINGSISGNRYFAVLDMITAPVSGTVEFFVGANTNGSNTTPAPAYSASNLSTPFVRAGRNIYLFTANQNDPNQRFALRGALTSAATAVFRNPAVYPITP